MGRPHASWAAFCVPVDWNPATHAGSIASIATSARPIRANIVSEVDSCEPQRKVRGIYEYAFPQPPNQTSIVKLMIGGWEGPLVLDFSLL